MIIALALLCFGLTEPAIDSALVRSRCGICRWRSCRRLGCWWPLRWAFSSSRRPADPRWARISLVVAICLMTLWVLFPDLPHNPVNGASWERTPVQSTLFGVSAELRRARSGAALPPPCQRHAAAADQGGTVAFVMLFIAEVVPSPMQRRRTRRRVA